jgi:Rieske Fe-S protein
VTDTELTRRSALGAAAVAVVGGLAGYLVARNSAAAKTARGATQANAYGPSTQGAGGTLLAPLAKIPVGGGLILTKPAVVLTRADDDTVHAFSAICTHQGCTVDKVSGGTIFCPCHGSTFNADTGAVTGGPAPRPLPAVPVAVRDGSVYTT